MGTGSRPDEPLVRDQEVGGSNPLAPTKGLPVPLPAQKQFFLGSPEFEFSRSSFQSFACHLDAGCLGRLYLANGISWLAGSHFVRAATRGLAKEVASVTKKQFF